MPRHLISDVHEWINEVLTVPTFALANPQPGERAWRIQRGKKTLLSLTLIWFGKWFWRCRIGGRTKNPTVKYHHFEHYFPHCMMKEFLKMDAKRWTLRIQIEEFESSHVLFPKGKKIQPPAWRKDRILLVPFGINVLFLSK